MLQTKLGLEPHSAHFQPMPLSQQIAPLRYMKGVWGCPRTMVKFGQLGSCLRMQGRQGQKWRNPGFAAQGWVLLAARVAAFPQPCSCSLSALPSQNMLLIITKHNEQSEPAGGGALLKGLAGFSLEPPSSLEA